VSADRDAEREQLAAALVFECELAASAAEARAAVDALLPTIDRIANQRAAVELEAAAAWAREAADNWGGDRTVEERKDVAHGGYVISNEITARATALRASNGEGTT
jgi:hypothetical protein